MTYAAVVIAAYLLGCIPTAYLVARWQKGLDIRRVGDGNAGAANVYREVGPGWGILTGAVDVGKGAAAVVISELAQSPTAVVMVAGMAAVMGHNWPLFLRLRGGRGAAAGAGVLLALFPTGMLILAAAALLPFAITRSVTAALAVLFAPLSFVAWALGEPWPLVGYSVALPALVGITHFLTTREAPATASCKEAHSPGNGKC